MEITKCDRRAMALVLVLTILCLPGVFGGIRYALLRSETEGTHQRTRHLVRPGGKWRRDLDRLAQMMTVKKIRADILTAIDPVNARIRQSVRSATLRDGSGSRATSARSWGDPEPHVSSRANRFSGASVKPREPMVHPSLHRGRCSRGRMSRDRQLPAPLSAAP